MNHSRIAAQVSGAITERKVRESLYLPRGIARHQGITPQEIESLIESVAQRLRRHLEWMQSKPENVLSMADIEWIHRIRNAIQRRDAGKEIENTSYSQRAKNHERAQIVRMTRNKRARDAFFDAPRPIKPPTKGTP